jgi:hypothetical protein
MDAPDQTDKPKGIEFYGGYQVYSESGVDLTLLRENLRQSPEERWQRGRRALAFALSLEQSSRLRRESAPLSDKPSDVMGGIALVRLLATHRVQYVIVGGHAMHAHGLIGSNTEEIEICYRRTPENLSALVTAFAPLHTRLRGAPAGLPFRFDRASLAAGVNFLLVTDHGYINLLGEVSGIGDFDQVLAHSEERTVSGLTIHILSLDGLIVAKKAAGRNKDQSHLLELVELKKLLDSARET